MAEDAMNDDSLPTVDATDADSSGHGHNVSGPDPADADAIVPVEEMDIVGGEACLDLVNTGAGRRLGPFRDKLRAYGDLVTWAERAGDLDPERGAELRREADRDPAGAERVLSEARALREAIYRVFTSSSKGEPATSADLAQISDAAARAAANRRLIPADEGYGYEWADERSLERPLWPAAQSAADLATSGDLTRVKECASDNCNWLFIDASRNRSRRWCDMKDCGNRAKARRFRQRNRSAQ